MCLAVPGQVVEWLERAAPFTSAWVEFGGLRRRVSMVCVPEAELGDYVLVHAGLAISRIDSQAAARLLADLADLAEWDPVEEELRGEELLGQKREGEELEPRKSVES
jgi:hydrogenase expression/formation protein HypC